MPEMVPPPPAAYPAPGMWAQSAYGGWPASAAPYGAYGTGAAYGGGATYGSSGGGGAGGQVCKDFTNGVCNRGVGCKFLHTGGPAAPPPARSRRARISRTACARVARTASLLTNRPPGRPEH